MHKFFPRFNWLVLLCSMSQPILAQTNVESFEEKILSCGELLEQIRASDCGNHIVDLFSEGYIAIGAAGYSLSASPTFDEGAARFSGGIHIMPYVSINTGLNFFDGTEMGWDFSIGWEQAHALTQTVSRDEGSKTTDLGGFAIGNTFSSEASLFYSYGARDSTPHRYTIFGVGFGVGYADVVGKAYLTEKVAATNALCDQAGSDLINGVSGAKTAIKDNCQLKSFRRMGIGVSGRVNIDVRYDNFYISFDSKIINLSSGRSLSLGSSGIELNPIISAVTVSYLYNL